MTLATTEAFVGILQGDHCRHGSRQGRRSFVVADSDGAGHRVDITGSLSGRIGGDNVPFAISPIGLVITRPRSLAGTSVRPFPFLAQVLLHHAASNTLDGLHHQVSQVREVCSLRLDGHRCGHWRRSGAAWYRSDISDGLRVRRLADNAHARRGTHVGVTEIAERGDGVEVAAPGNLLVTNGNEVPAVTPFTCTWPVESVKVAQLLAASQARM